MSLEKAQLIKLKPDKGSEQIGDPIPVQFNPASLRMTLTNDSEGGRTRGRQPEQHLGSSSTQLSFDLHFDTADAGTNVFALVGQVEQFVLPSVPESKQTPPRIRFHWGAFVYEGVVSGLQEEIDLFSSAGVPLRAKVGVTIKNQDPKFTATAAGPGWANASDATPVGKTPATPGTSGGGQGNRSGTALGGESAAAFAARMGVDPNAWRGLDVTGLDTPLSLPAGLEIGFSANLSASLGLGAQAGIEAGVGGSIEQAFGLQTAGGGAAQNQAGFALAAAGGVRAAAETVQIAKSGQAASQARAAFATPSAAAAAGLPSKPAAPEQARTPLTTTGLTVGPAPPAPAAPAPPRADPRDETYGFGVPLRPRVGGAAAERSGPYGGWIVVGVRAPRDDRDPTQPAWVGLRPAPAPSAPADRPKPCGCGCGGGCGC